MAEGNHVTIIGNLTDDPELRTTESGAHVAGMWVVINHRFKGDDGKWVDGDASFFRVSAWRAQAERVGELLHKGDRVIVSGRVRQRKWERDGQKRSSVEIEADEIGLSLRSGRNWEEGQ